MTSPSRIVSGTSFGLGIPGGVIASSKELHQLLMHRSRVLSSEPPSPPCFAAGLHTAIDICELDLFKREMMSAAAERVRRSLSAVGVVPASEGRAPIVSVEVPRGDAALKAWEMLLGKGVLTDITSARTPRSERWVLRVSVSSQHSEKDIDLLISALGESSAALR